MCCAVAVIVTTPALGSCGPFQDEDLTPLIRAIQDQDAAKTAELLDQGADPNRRALTYPLTLAAGKEDVEILRLLFVHGADYERAVEKDDGWSPLFSAAQSGPVEAVRILISRGADPCRRTDASWVSGKRPSEVARDRNPRVVTVLEEAETGRC